MQHRARVEPGKARVCPHDAARLRPRRQRADLAHLQRGDDVDARGERLRGLRGRQAQRAAQILEEARDLGGHDCCGSLRNGCAGALRTRNRIRSCRLIAFTHDQRHK